MVEKFPRKSRKTVKEFSWMPLTDVSNNWWRHGLGEVTAMTYKKSQRTGCGFSRDCIMASATGLVFVAAFAVCVLVTFAAGKCYHLTLINIFVLIIIIVIKN